jgi:NADPH2:quinone reductase
LGEGVTPLKVGQRVACLGGIGGFGTHAVVPAQICLPLPDALSLDEAAALIMTYGTSHHALFDRAALKAGETLLVLGASGGVGTAAIQLGKAAGARVIAAASSEAKCALCRSLGADETLLYGGGQSPQALREAIKSLTAGRGPDVVYDPVGGELAEPVFRSIAWRGRYLVIGFAGGQIPALPWNLMLLKGASLVGVFYGDFARKEPQANAAMLAQLADWVVQGKIKPVIDLRLPMTELKAAYARMGSRAVMGKVVLHNPAV